MDAGKMPSLCTLRPKVVESFLYQIHETEDVVLICIFIFIKEKGR